MGIAVGGGRVHIAIRGTVTIPSHDRTEQSAQNQAQKHCCCDLYGPKHLLITSTKVPTKYGWKQPLSNHTEMVKNMITTLFAVDIL